MKEMQALQEMLPLHIDSAVFVLQVPYESALRRGNVGCFVKCYRICFEITVTILEWDTAEALIRMSSLMQGFKEPEIINFVVKCSP